MATTCDTSPTRPINGVTADGRVIANTSDEVSDGNVTAGLPFGRSDRKSEPPPTL